MLAGAGTASAQSSVTVKGTITSAEDNSPVVGATVISADGRGVSSDLDGLYSIQVPAGSVLTYSFLGYTTVEFTVPEGAATTITHDVQLAEEAARMDDVVVIAYGVRKKGTIAGSVSTVKAEKVETTPTAAFDQALQGQVPGLSVISSTGEPSAAATMSIRGTNSINSGTAPLYILDGVAISASDFNTINPSDIESISVLKDASSTSIYGARAANGVIVITSKRGTRIEAKPTINYRMQLGFSQLAYGNWDMMNTAERIQYEKELGLTAGKNYNVLSQTDVNWIDMVYKNRALLQNYELSVSGATEQTSYYISGGYYEQEGIALGSNFNRYSLRTNVEQRMAKWLRMGMNTMFNYQGIEQADEGSYTLVTPISAAHFMLPYYSPYKADGSLASVNDGSWKGIGQNPLEWLANNPLEYKKYKVLSTIFAEVTPLKGLTIRSQFGVDYGHTTGFSRTYPSYAPNLGEGTASRSTSDRMSLSVSNTVNYQFSLGSSHNFNFMVGQEGVNYHYEDFSVSSAGQRNDKLTDISSGTYAQGWSDTVDNDYALLSFFARGEYNYDSRYYGEFALRTDGSSRFGANNRYAFFWSLGFMWDMRNEAFMQSSRRWLTTAQVSLSTGTSGNSEIPNYEHLALSSSGANYGSGMGIAPVTPGNESLTWESTWATNLGLHFGFWNRLNVDLELYNKKTTDMLMYVPLPASTSNGFGGKWDNIGAMVNRGVELNLTGTLLAVKDFIWTVNANVSYNHNKLTELYGDVTEYENSTTALKYMVGHPVSEFYMNRYAGVNPANGDALWYTKDGELTNEMRDDDRVMTGKSYVAPWAGGFGTTLSWKGLSLSAQFSWVGERYMMNNDRYFDESNGMFMSYNQSKRLLGRWKQPGDITDIPRHGVYPQFDTHLLEDASFLRLKNLMISYSLPANLLRKTHFIQGIRVYAQGQNLLTFTKFSGLDPESPANIYQAQYPMSRQFTFGLDLTF